jgi:hypothetical protein
VFRKRVAEVECAESRVEQGVGFLVNAESFFKIQNGILFIFGYNIKKRQK